MKWGKGWVAGREHPFREDVDLDSDIDAGTEGQGEMYEFINVLWVERRRSADGNEDVAYRKALGRIRKAVWERELELPGLAECAERDVDVVLG